MPGSHCCLAPHGGVHSRIAANYGNISAIYGFGEPYSIDEQHLDVTGSLSLFGEPLKLAHLQRNNTVR